MDTTLSSTSCVSRGPESLPEDIYKLLDDDTDHSVSEDNVEWAGDLFKEILRSRLAKRETLQGEQVLRFSSLGKSDRQIWYAANKPETAEKLPGKVKFKFLYGDLIEVLTLFLAKEAGHSVEDCQYEVEEDGVKGHIDAIIDGVLTDVKSASSYSYEKFKSKEYLFDDAFGYINQLSGYANCLRDVGKLKETRAGFLVVDKVNGSILFEELDKEYIEGNKPGPRIAHLRKVIAMPEPPSNGCCGKAVPEGKSGNMKLDVRASYCPYKCECYKDSNGGQGLRKFFYSRGPVWLTRVVKEPKVDEA